MSLSARSFMLQSVFPSTSDDTRAPTPQATPLLAQESFGINDQAAPSFNDTASESIRWERAWHTATSFLTEKLQAEDATRESRSQQKEARAAIEYLVSPDSVGWKLRKDNKEDDLVWWYSQTLQEQFLDRHRGTLLKSSEHLTEDPTSWQELRANLTRIRMLLLGPFQEFLSPLVSLSRRASLMLLQLSYSALVSKVLLDRLRQPLLRLLKSRMAQVLDANAPENYAAETSMEGVESPLHDDAQSSLQQTLSDLMNGGLPREPLERILAVALEAAISSHVANTCSGRWASPSPIARELRDWVAGPFTALAKMCLGAIRGASHDHKHLVAKIHHTEVAIWQQSALHALGLLRMSELFDIIVDWDIGSRGGIEDLRQYVSSQETRMQVVNHFNDILKYRLLHPGASTDQILEVYIKIMRAFAVLDPRFVILHRVSRPIRRYLRDRDDTIRIIVAGLLSDPSNPETTPDALGELAVELHEMDEIADLEDDDDDGDLEDMSWNPNPADAEVDYKGSKSGLDVIGNLLSLFEAKDVVVKEFQNILGERLLSPESDFSREIRVLELLKSRFGEAALQGCEVMIKDIFDSSRTDVLIKKEQDITHEDDSVPRFYSKILSRFFWPSLRDDDFRIPAQVQALQERYSAGFEEHKTQRKLAWLPSLGQVRVELQLEDRAVDEIVTTWQASVIYAFNGADEGQSPDLTSEQVATRLEMDADLVANALTFWVSKLVLYEPAPGMYRVLEVLPTEETTEDARAAEQASADIVAAAHSASAAAAASAASAVRSEEELAEEKMEVLWQYVVGMLTNQGSMPLQQMVMMLNFVVPGGFSHSQEDFGRFLQRKVNQGLLQMSGAAFKMPKK